MMSLEDPRFWVAVAFVLVMVLSYKKVSRHAGNSLDERSAAIKLELDTARTIREEAATLLADYQRKQADYLKEAEQILLNARENAASLQTYSEQTLKDALDARMKQALDKIAREEAQAVAEVRNHVVDIAIASARALIAEHVSALPQDELVKLALGDLERKLH